LRLTLPTPQGDATWLVVSELHLGLESELASRGAFLRSRTDALAAELIADADRIGARRVLMLGDIKHRYTHTSPQEARDLPRFFRRLEERFDEIVITPGNHDTGLRALVPADSFRKTRIGDAHGELLGSGGFLVGAMHGHTWPRPLLLRADVWLVGHTHAAASLVDQHGEAGIEWAWLRGHLDDAKVHKRYGRRVAPRIIVFPPFNPLCGGTPINRDGLLGPVGTLVDPNASSLWLLDGRRAMDLEGHDLVARRRLGAAAN
jgi:metallophosphoesterase superfamily enzyme